MHFRSRLVIFSIFLVAAFAVYGILIKNYSAVFNSFCTLLCLCAFALLHNKFPVLDNKTYCAFVIFIMLSVFAGRTLNMYAHIPYWDKFLHFSSGFIFASSGTQIYKKLKGDDKNHILMNLFVLSFSVALAGLWEIYEFSIDSLLGTTAQNGSLSDTMWDMIAGTLGTIITIALISKKKNNGS